MNIEKIYEAMLEDEAKEKEFETPEYNSLYRQFCGKHCESIVGAELTDITEYVQRNAFAVGFRTAEQLMLEGRNTTGPDMSPVWDDAGKLLDDIEAELSGCLAIANELHIDLGEDDSQYTDLAYALWSCLHRLSKDVSFRHNAECMAAKTIREKA